MNLTVLASWFWRIATSPTFQWSESSISTLIAPGCTPFAVVPKTVQYPQAAEALHGPEVESEVGPNPGGILEARPVRPASTPSLLVGLGAASIVLGDGMRDSWVSDEKNPLPWGLPEAFQLFAMLLDTRVSSGQPRSDVLPNGKKVFASTWRISSCRVRVISLDFPFRVFQSNSQHSVDLCCHPSDITQRVWAGARGKHSYLSPRGSSLPLKVWNQKVAISIWCRMDLFNAFTQLLILSSQWANLLKMLWVTCWGLAGSSQTSLEAVIRLRTSGSSSHSARQWNLAYSEFWVLFISEAIYSTLSRDFKLCLSTQKLRKTRTAISPRTLVNTR